MGTRSLTVIENEDGKEIVVMYRQFDGYPEGHGVELAEFLKSIHLVNGLGLTETRKVANGMGCLAAQLIAHFKDEPGQFYLYPAGTRDCWEDYVYYVYASGDQCRIRICRSLYTGSNTPPGEAGIFNGTPTELIAKNWDEDEEE